MIKTAKSGYTIIEVLIVLAISTSLMFAAIAIFKGQQGETQFTQSVQDFSSKIISYSNQVTAGTFPDSDNYACNPGSGGAPPTLSITGANKNLGGRDGCLFLGRAIQVQQNSGDVYIYTVLGNVNDSAGGVAGDISSSSPEPAYRTDVPACGQGYKKSNCWVLTDKYSFDNGPTITKAWINGVASTQPWYMAGIYTDLDANADNSAGTLQLSLWGYNLDGTTANNPGPYSFGSGKVKDCIEATASSTLQCNTLTKQINTWNLCIDSNASHTSLLSIFPTSSGLSTKLTDNGC